MQDWWKRIDRLLDVILWSCLFIALCKAGLQILGKVLF